MTTHQTFGDLLRSLRGNRSQSAVAAILGVSRPRVSLWECDHERPAIGRLDGMLTSLGVDPDDDATRALAVRLLAESP